MTFTPVRRRPRLADTVSETILRTVLDRHLQPGDSLPTERELCEQFQVSRQVIREALQALVGRGVIEMRQSASAVVAKVDPSVVSTSMMLYLHTSIDDAELLIREVRLVLEPAIAAQAALRATADDIASLQVSYDRVVSAVDVFHKAQDALTPSVVDAVLTADLEFHLQVARATHNGIYLIMLEATRDAQMVDRRVAVSRPGSLRWEVERHAQDLSKILDAIKAGDPEGARAAMLLHLQDRERQDRRRTAEVSPSEQARPPA